MKDDDSSKKKSTGDSFMHSPLPYVVKLRLVASEDAPPSASIECKVTAYSILEAYMQAIMETSGKTSAEGEYKIEKIEPDIKRYSAMILDAVLSRK